MSMICYSSLSSPSSISFKLIISNVPLPRVSALRVSSMTLQQPGSMRQTQREIRQQQILGVGKMFNHTTQGLKYKIENYGRNGSNQYKKLYVSINTKITIQHGTRFWQLTIFFCLVGTNFRSQTRVNNELPILCTSFPTI